jgi:hypothetical protein
MADAEAQGVLAALLRIVAHGKGRFVEREEQVSRGARANALLDGAPQRLELPRGPAGEAFNPDEDSWPIARAGILRFSFASQRQRDADNDLIDRGSLQALRAALADPDGDEKRRLAALETQLGVDVLICFDQVADLLAALAGAGLAGDVRKSKAQLVQICFHKLLEAERARDLLGLLDPDARRVAEHAIGRTAFSFTRNNPTGPRPLPPSRATPWARQPARPPP